MEKQRSLRGKIWNVRATNMDFKQTESARRQNGLTPQKWRDPSFSDLEDPLALHGVQRACDRINQAITAQERIMVYGDFDCDGITSTVALVDGLKSLGALVSYRIPDREKDSHGLKKELIDEIVLSETKLLITVDCGVNDKESVEHAVNLGLEVIITDHHKVDPERVVNQAVAVVNPSLPECSYPCKNLAGVGVVFKLLQALNDDETWLQPYLALAAIGTVADCVSLTGESRILVQLGLKALNKGAWPGLLSLLGGEEEITSETIGFQLAPCINAASRLGEVSHAVQLFLGNRERTADRVAYLQQLNQARKQLTAEFTAQGSAQINTDLPCQVVVMPECPAGILGLVASRITEQTGQAVFCLNQNDSGELHASCRGPQGGDISAALNSVASYLNTFGGHAGAAGFRIDEQHLADLINGLHDWYQGHPAKPTVLNLTAEVPVADLSFELLKWQNSLAPFGMGNPQPMWQVSGLELIEIYVMGAEENHARFTFKGGQQAVAFNCIDLLEKIEEGQTYDLAITLNTNTWNGDTKLQWQLVDVMRRCS